MEKEDLKTVLKFDSGRKGFDKAVIFLVILAICLAIFGLFWVYSFYK
tara:strand:+ start:547 stop:687 length:141 start_codon:yes stop_codon:yes gene_type:complete